MIAINPTDIPARKKAMEMMDNRRDWALLPSFERRELSTEI